MTTETLRRTPSTGVRALLGAAAAAVAGGLGLVLLAAVVADAAAVRGALIGATTTVLVFAVGSFVVDTVARLMPAAALLIALLTYTLQIVAMGALFWSLATSGALESTIDRTWVGAAVIAVTVCWLGVQLALTTRARIPAYDVTLAGAVPGPGGGAGR